MANTQVLLSKLNEISELIDLDNFYAIGLSPYQISLQGKFNDTNTAAAKKLNVKLEYQEDNGMLKGESEDGTVRIVLT
jgi:hypothetical protein